jgi:DMSO/TMAO reductase YedYZ molybdopterin-dependent catalytic subunit
MEPTKTNKKLVLVTVVLAAIVLTAVFVVSYAPQQAKTLTPGEINEYQGQNLSSINDFRENSIKGPQYVNKTTYCLLITGLVNETLELSYDDIVNHYQNYKKVVTLNCVEGWSVDILWEGVLVKDLLEQAGINPEAKVVIFDAYDGYSTSLPLDFITDNNILMAHKMNNVVLPPERGFPFQLVAESKYGYKWIKWIVRIELSDDVNYQGYWESRGFSNDATVP